MSRFDGEIEVGRMTKAPLIAVVGSYATGLTMKVKRLPSRGETLLGTGYRVDFGGKGSNQAVGCARLGAQVRFVAKVGKDAFGEMALGLYRDEGVDASGVKQVAEGPTGVGFIVVEEGTGNNCIVLDPGANELLTAEDVAAETAALQGCAVVLTQLEIPVAAAEAALRMGRSQGAITILNPAPVRELPAAVLECVDILTPNLTEAKVLAGLSAESAIDAKEVARELIARGAKQVVVTLGEEGALIVSRDSAVRVPAVAVTAVDTTGAGDAFNAGLATALASGASLAAAVEFAVVIGGLAVTREGVIPSLPTRAEVRAFYERGGKALPVWFQG